MLDHTCPKQAKRWRKDAANSDTVRLAAVRARDIMHEASLVGKHATTSVIDTEGGGGESPLADIPPPPPPPFCGNNIAMFSAINVYTSASAHSINMFPPLAKNPVSIPAHTVASSA